MDGIEALKMMKEGRTVLMYRNKGTTSPTDAFYRFDFKYSYDKEETSKDLWTRFRCENYWHKCENPARFWMVADNFEVVSDDECGMKNRMTTLTIEKCQSVKYRATDADTNVCCENCRYSRITNYEPSGTKFVCDKLNIQTQERCVCKLFTSKCVADPNKMDEEIEKYIEIVANELIKFEITCSQCGRFGSTFAHNVPEARYHFLGEGWKVSKSKPICPECRGKEE